MELIDETDLVAADAGTLGVREGRGRNPLNEDFAAVGMLEQAGDVQQR